MGVMRLILSLLVVGSHVGGMGEVPSGATAIAGFFTISGFLMARTIFENYSTAERRLEGAARFYLNRFVRIVPPFAAVALLTFGLLWIRAGRGFQILLECGLLPGVFRNYLLAEGKIKERVITLEEFRNVPEFFLINSVRKWIRIIRG